METWITVAVGIVLMVVSAVSKNKKEMQRRTANNKPNRGVVEEEEMSIPDIFSTIFDFGGSKPVEKPEVVVVPVESEDYYPKEDFHQRFENTVSPVVQQEVVVDTPPPVVQAESVSNKYGGSIELDSVDDAYVQNVFMDGEIGDMVDVVRGREKIDPRKMIIYSELLKPKYKEV